MNEGEPRIMIKPAEELGKATVLAVDLVVHSNTPMILVREGIPLAALIPLQGLIPENNLGLSDRMHDYAQLLAAGRPNKEIAKTLCVTPHTVKYQVHQLFSKLGVNNRAEAALRLRDAGILPPQSIS